MELLRNYCGTVVELLRNCSTVAGAPEVHYHAPLKRCFLSISLRDQSENKYQTTTRIHEEDQKYEKGPYLRNAGGGGGGRRVALLLLISKYSPKIALHGEGGGHFFPKFALRNISMAPYALKYILC